MPRDWICWVDDMMGGGGGDRAGRDVEVLSVVDAEERVVSVLI